MSSVELRTDVLKYSARFGRAIRQDPPEQLGVPTQSLVFEALARGRRDEGLALAEYMLEEFRYLFDTMMSEWVGQLRDHAIQQLELRQGELLLRVPATHIWTALLKVGETMHADGLQAIRSGQTELAQTCLDHARRVFKTMNDEMVRFVQDLLTCLDNEGGEGAPIQALRGPYETIWRKRYADWESFSAEERLQLSCEGMRSHFGGPQRLGDFTVVDEGIRYRMSFAPCGTGGILRWGDPETGDGPWETTGVNRTPAPYTWGKVGVPWYCTHCNLYLEHWPAEDTGRLLRPVLYEDDPASPVSASWLIYKNLADTQAEDYERIGLEPPPGATRGYEFRHGH